VFVLPPVDESGNGTAPAGPNITLTSGQTVVIVIASNITIGTGINIEVGQSGIGLIQIEGTGCVSLQGTAILQINTAIQNGSRADLVQAECLSDDGIQLETSGPSPPIYFTI
jgi:hypothetical protein